MSNERRLFWLSFADEGKPVGSQFLGVVIASVEDDDEIDEVFDLAQKYGINFNEDVRVHTLGLPGDWAATLSPSEIGRVLGREEAQGLSDMFKVFMARSASSVQAAAEVQS